MFVTFRFELRKLIKEINGAPATRIKARRPILHALPRWRVQESN